MRAYRPFELRCRKMACRPSLEAAARAEFVRVERLGIGAASCVVTVHVPRVRDREGVPDGVIVQLNVEGGRILTATGPVGRGDVPEDVVGAIRRGFAELERRLWEWHAARVAASTPHLAGASGTVRAFPPFREACAEDLPGPASEQRVQGVPA